MSSEITVKSNAQLEDEYYRSEEEEFNEFKEFKKEKLRKAGIKLPETELGESVHPGTLKSYRDLGIEVPDNVRLATLRPNERMKQHLLALNQNVKISKVIRQVFRVKDETTEDEYMIYSYAEYFRDPNGNLRKLEYTRVGAHDEIYGDKKIDHSFRQTGFEVRGKKLVFDIKWDSEQFEDLMKTHNQSVNELKKQKIGEEIGQPSLVVGYGKPNGHDIFTKRKKKFTIKNAEDFQTGKFEELYQLGQRALSSATPSLKKLSQPVSEDPSSSLHKKERGYLSSNLISYTQQSYR